MTTLLFTRPAQWDAKRLPGVKFVHAPVFGAEPMLRGGAPMGDSVGGCATDAGLDKLVQAFEQHKPDAFLFWAMYGWSDTDKHQLASVQATLATCKRIAPACKFFYGNGNQATTIVNGQPDFNVLAFKDLIDVVLDTTRDKRIAAMYEAHGLGHDTLHTFGFDPDDIADYSELPATKDLFFGGSYTGYSRFPNSAFRHKLLTTMAQHFDLEVRGRGNWPVPHKPYVHAMDYPKLIGGARIALGCYHADLHRYYTKRTIYSLATGRPYLVRYIPGMEMDFDINTELVAYRTVPDAVNAARALLEDRDLRVRVGKAGRARAIKDHSWDARARDMVGILARWL